MSLGYRATFKYRIIHFSLLFPLCSINWSYYLPDSTGHSIMPLKMTDGLDSLEAKVICIGGFCQALDGGILTSFTVGNDQVIGLVLI